MQHHKIGLFIIISSVLVPIFPFIILAKAHPNIPILGQYFGVASLIVMSFGQLFATRARGLESIFGPLDKNYILHKWLGITAVVTMLIHNTVGAEIKALNSKSFWADFGESLGEIGMNGILVLVGLSLALFIPYNWWRLSHKLIGAFFVMCALHFMMIDKPFALTDPLGLYIFIICVIGIVSYVVSLLPSRFMRSFQYKVTHIEPTGDAVAITMAPNDKAIRHRSGQFAFFSFAQKGLEERHPFTISSAPNPGGAIRITVKGLGRYTRNLGKSLEMGSEVSVQGPFGNFGGTQAKADQIWIAAGVGITPFIALLDDWDEHKSKLNIFYAYRGAKTAIHLDEITSLAQSKNIGLHLYDSSKGHKLSSQSIVDVVGTKMVKSKALYCGPKTLRADLQSALKELGLKTRNFHFEEFEIRSDFWPLTYINQFAYKWLSRTEWSRFF